MSVLRIRLYLDRPFGPGQPLALDEGQANYLFAVMRLSVGDALLVFNGRDGEWRATVAEAGKRRGMLVCVGQERPQAQPPDLWLLFAPLRKARTDMVVEKAVELGVRRIVPVQTERTQGDRLRQDKMRAHAIEAAEQCGALFVPEVADVQPLSQVLAGWDHARGLILADEGLAGGGAAAWADAPPAPAAILIGPEGGFAAAERDRLRGLPFVTPLPLGPRVLRAETAVIAALTLWQAARGDWR
jgi:16S rRNA (uracil1498-N3)-methyltransferase